MDDPTQQKDLSLGQMMEMQKRLWALHAQEWSPMTPAYGRERMLWIVEELGECIALIKKQGDAKIAGDPAVRAAFAEELCDVLMYLSAVLLCYGYTPEEVACAYEKKHARNLSRDYEEDHQRQYSQMEQRFLHREPERS